ncbi:hypothetical protein [Bacillus sp. AFS029533]|uniref:hypothetical protein n=1 Tax=Bacillus sp. AFS029533 TaxID=2033494 RepID=UPI000BFB8B54|nr:hypothetical protein [Bacillus sp. AFS029533]PGZ92243.1 hypothetical protein COE53_12835 [Bacillus sp. AFS029533]
MNKSRSSLSIGKIEVFLPNHSISYFYIAEDLADFFEMETNYEAVKYFRKILRENMDLKDYKKIEFDRESSEVVIRTSNALVMLGIVVLMNKLINFELSKEEIRKVEQQLLSHKRPKKQKWTIGNLFLISLSNNTYALGQVVWLSYSEPVCGLFDINFRKIPDLFDTDNYNYISVLSLTSCSLDDYSWKVVGNKDVMIDKSEVDRKHIGGSEIGSISHTSGVLDDLAEAYFGIQLWNDMYDEDYYDQLLLPSVTRPSTSIILSPLERERYLK